MLVFGLSRLGNEVLFLLITGFTLLLNQASAILLASKETGHRLIEMENKRSGYERSVNLRFFVPVTKGPKVELNKPAENVLN